MTLRQIEILRALMRLGTTMGAARALGMSQPAVSNALKHMEAQGNPVELWPARKAKKRVAKAKTGA